MASDEQFVRFVAETMADAGIVSYRKMFGEYTLYCDGKVVALVCGDRLFVKPTDGGRSVLGTVTEAAPYPGAKPHFLIEDRLEDRDWLSGLIRITAAELPEPKPKKPKKPK